MSVDGKMEALNNAAREVIPHLRDVAAENPNVDVWIRVLSFSSGAHWEVETPHPIETFSWTDLSAGGRRDIGAALTLVAKALKTQMPLRGLPPVLVLISDGAPTDDFDKGLKELMAQPWARRAVRAAIAIGKDANLDVLERFIGNKELKPLQANSPEALIRIIKFVSTTVEDTSMDATKDSSQPEDIGSLSQSDSLTKSMLSFGADTRSVQTARLDDLPRQKLCDIISEYGSTLYHNPQRCEALLRDLCAKHKREISVLIAALKFGVVHELTSDRMASPQILVARLSEQLETEVGLTPNAARWAVDSWAIAIGVLSRADGAVDEAETISPKKRPTVPDRYFRIVAPTGSRESVSLAIRNGEGEEPAEPYWYKREAEKIKKYVLSVTGRPILLTGYGHFGESYLMKWAIDQSAIELAKRTGTAHETVLMRVPVDLLGQDSGNPRLDVGRWVLEVWENPKYAKVKKRYVDKLRVLGEDPFFSLRELTTTETEGAPRAGIHISGPVGGATFSGEGKGHEWKKIYVPLSPERQLEKLLQSLASSLPLEPAGKLMKFINAFRNDGIPYRIVLIVDKIDEFEQLKALEPLLRTGGALKIVIAAEKSHYDAWRQNGRQANWIESFFKVIKCSPILDSAISARLARFFLAIDDNDFAASIVRDFIEGLNFHCYGSPASLPKKIFNDWANDFDEKGSQLILSDGAELMNQYRIWARANRLLCREWEEIIGNYAPFQAPDHPTLGEYETRARLFLYRVIKEIIHIGNSGFSERRLLEFCRQSERLFNLEMDGKNLVYVSRRLLEAACRVGMLEVVQTPDTRGLR